MHKAMPKPLDDVEVSNSRVASPDANCLPTEIRLRNTPDWVNAKEQPGADDDLTVPTTTIRTSKRPVLRQISREFALPFTGAMLWTAWQMSVSPWSTSPITSAVATFGPAFFLFSWATGQVVRVRKQAFVEEGFRGVEARLQDALGQIETRIDGVIDTITGGASFCYLTLNDKGVLIQHVGGHPVYDLTAIIWNQMLSHGLEEGRISESCTFSAPYVMPGTLRYVEVDPAPIPDIWTKVNVVFYARNGTFIQRIRRSAPGCQHATRVERRINGKDSVIYEDIPPPLLSWEIDWN
jgi:hypothetical protein